MPGESLESLRRFFETSPAARKATRSLGRDARVGLELAEGPARFRMEAGAPRVEDGAEPDPDFTLVMPPAAVRQVTSLEGDDVGEFGVAFFQLVLSRDPAQHVRVRVQASTARLVAHGYLGVLATGGMKVTWWLLRNGVKNPKAAIDRLRGR
jgi:hypothetical protein